MHLHLWKRYLFCCRVVVLVAIAVIGGLLYVQNKILSESEIEIAE